MRLPQGTPELTAVRQHWRLWTAVVELFARRRRARRRVEARAYEALHRELLAACRSLAETADETTRPLYRGLEELARPWLSPLVLERADREILLGLLDRCRQAERQLGGGGWGEVAWRGVAWGLAALAAAGVGLVLWRTDWLWGWAAEHVQDLWRQLRWAVRQSSEGERWLAGGAVLAVIVMLLLWRGMRGAR